MPRQRMPAGSMGKVQMVELAGGRFQARAGMRDDAHELHNVKGSGATPEEAIAELRRNAAEFSTKIVIDLSEFSTVAEACDIWLKEMHALFVVGGQNAMAETAFEAYEHIVRTGVAAEGGAVPLAHLNADTCERIIRRIWKSQSLSAAHQAKGVLWLMCETAIRRGAMRGNPVRHVRPLPS